MAIGNLFGTGGESNSLYGTSLTSNSASSFIYFEWFIFKVSTGQPTTPTGGSWDFATNTGTPPTGWTSTVNGVPSDNLWFSVAFIDSRNPTNIVWSTAGLLSATTSVYATAYADTFTGTGSTTVWTLTADPVVVNNLDVSINGVTQTPTVDYTISGTTFTTTTAAPLGSIILVKYRQALPNSYFGTANNVGYTPFSWIAATNVQAALNEVATDVSATDGVSGSNLVGYKSAGTGAVATTVQAKLRQYVSVKDFGALGDNSTDDTAAIQLALNYAGSVNGCTVFFPSGIYKVTDVLLIKNNTTLDFAGSIKVYAMPTGGYEAVLATDPPTGASNITILNPQIDLNSIIPASGILIRYASQNIRIEGGYIRNGLNSTTYSGGRGINIEGGDTPTDVTVSGVTIENCWEGVSLSGGTGQATSNISVSNLTINDCQSAIGLSGNASGYPHTGAAMQGVFNNISINNCGVVTTYSRQAGVINSNRGSNVMFNNIYIYNSAAYGNPDSLWRGDANNIKMTNVTMEGDVGGSIFNFSSYQESNSFPLATYSSLDSVFSNVTLKGITPAIIDLPVTTAAYLTNCQFYLTTYTVSNDKPTTSYLDNKTDVYMQVQNKTKNSIITGYASDIGSGTTFTQFQNQDVNLSQIGNAKAYAVFVGSSGTVTRGSNISVTRSSAGTYSIAFTRAFSTTGYTVIAMVDPSSVTNYNVMRVSSKSGSGFNLETFLGTTATDFANVNLVIYY